MDARRLVSLAGLREAAGDTDFDPDDYHLTDEGRAAYREVSAALEEALVAALGSRGVAAAEVRREFRASVFTETAGEAIADFIVKLLP
jgi:hypothetical protein